MKKFKEFKLLEELTSKEEHFINASKNNDINTIKKLLPLVDVNIKTNNGNNGNNALIYASYYGYKEVVEILLKHPSIDVNIQNNDGYTALIWSSYYGYKEVVELLLKHPSIDVNIQTNNGNTALIWASSEGYKEIVELLLKQQSIDVNIQTNNGKTALIYASINGYKEIVELLIPFLEEDSFVDSFYQKLKDEDFNEIYIKVKEYLGRLKPIYATDIREILQEMWDLNYYKDSNLLIKLFKI